MRRVDECRFKVRVVLLALACLTLAACGQGPAGQSNEAIGVRAQVAIGVLECPEGDMVVEVTDEVGPIEKPLSAGEEEPSTPKDGLERFFNTEPEVSDESTAPWEREDTFLQDGSAQLSLEEEASTIGLAQVEDVGGSWLVTEAALCQSFVKR